MEITELKRKGKSETYYTSINGELVCTLELETIVKHHLKVGVILDEDDFFKIKKESDKLVCFSKGLKYISSRLKTEKQMRDYLMRNNYDEEAVNECIDKLKSYGYLNDDYYAKTYAESLCKTKGKRYIKQELISKGVKKSQVDNILEDIEDESDACKNVCTKWLKNKTLPLDKKDKEKLFRFLLARGFDYDTIKSVYYKIDSNQEEDFD